MTIPSPAKLNLVLRIRGKRADGYHELVTLFHRISLKDTLVLRKRKRGFRLICRHPGVPQKNNLMERAYRLLKKTRPSLPGVRVRLVKRIPVGGGLGGGSSNAASFLIGANRLFRLGLNQKELTRLGGKLGSDVSFFISDARQALGEGRGEKIYPLPFRRKLWFLLFPERKGLSTRRVYEGYRASNPRPSLTRLGHDVRIISTFLERGKLKETAGLLQNDLLASAEKIRPSLKKKRETLGRLQLGMCQMSGSGPTHFMMFASRHKALHAARRLRQSKFSGPYLLAHSE